MHVIIQAGGKGTRLESLTRNRPKCLVPVDNRPMIFWTFEAFKGADFSVICDYPKSRSKPSRYSSENDVLIEKSVKYTDFFLLSIVYV